MFIKLYSHFNITGEVLQDKKKNGKERNWKKKKDLSLKVSESFERIGLENRAMRVSSCGSYLQFGECSHDGHKKLLNANFCRDRLCPTCNWRRSMMLGKQISTVVGQAVHEQELRFIFLTLTVRNSKGDELDKDMDCFFEGFRRLFQYKKVDNAVVGWVRSMEVTRNNDRSSENYGTYHPHFHVLIAVKPSYFTGSDYIDHFEWVQLWKRALKVDYMPVVDVRTVKGKGNTKASLQAAILETAKYSVKDSDYLCDTEEETDEAIRVLSGALKGRRLVGFGKLFKEIKSKLALSDVEDENADLIGDDKKEHVCPICGGKLEEVLYIWDLGYHNYFKVGNIDDIDDS